MQKILKTQLELSEKKKEKKWINVKGTMRILAGKHKILELLMAPWWQMSKTLSGACGRDHNTTNACICVGVCVCVYSPHWQQ